MDSSKEIKLDKDVRDKLRSGVNKLANVVLTTMGPNGSTVIIADEFGDPYITKDGVSVSNYITLEDPVENIAATLLKQVAQRTVDQAGDGTTTSICLAQSFINIGFDLIENGESYNNIKKDLELLEEEVIFQLIKSSKELDISNIIDVATISSNNDEVIGKLIQEAYNHSNIVKVEESNRTEDELITISGMELPTGYFNNAFINKANKQAVEYSEPIVILIKGKLDKVDDISKLLLDAKNKPIVIIADHFSDQVLSIFKDNYNRGAFSIVPVKSPGFATHRINLMEDIAVYTGATLLSPNIKYSGKEYFGSLKSVYITKDKCILTNSENLVGVDERLSDLKEVLANSTDNNETNMLTQRIENLTGKIAIIKVGGNSEVEVKERKDRIDDAVLAVKSALEEGIVEGGGVALIKSSNLIKQNNFSKCLLYPSEIIQSNSDYTIMFLPDEDMFKLNIIDPLKVTRCALQNAISVAKTILSTKAVVLDKNLWS